MSRSTPKDSSVTGTVARSARSVAKSAGRRASKVVSKVTDARLHELAASRVAIENVTPCIDGGRFPAKVVAGQAVRVEADVFCDGHDKIACAVLTRAKGAKDWIETPLEPLGNDRWHATVTFPDNAMHEMQVIGWRDLWAAWLDEVVKKREAGVAIDLEIIEGRKIVEDALESSDRLAKGDKPALRKLLKAMEKSTDKGFAAATDPVADEIMTRVGLRTNFTEGEVLPIWADRAKAAFSAWYELFPRSMSHDESRHGTFDDVIERLPYVADLGFDVLYFPPIHPIGTTNRKGRNNTLNPEPGDVGVPYAIGSEEGGHMAVHPELGTPDDFDRLVAAAAEHGLEIALDIALNASPDHPWIEEHPEWFDWRPDGTIRFAENPPKKYEDIVNFHFYRDALPSVWHAMRDMFLFWVEHGVKIFRVDNPHTKPLPFWQWLIEDIQKEHPDTIFLAEAFTRPKVMKRLAKVGFNQSYTYFTWRNEKWELEEYMLQLTGQAPDAGGLGGADMPFVYRPNFFVNTPDINPHYLQTGGRAAHRVRVLLAATLVGNWGLYNGFEVCDARPLPKPGGGTKEEYLDSEKYQLRAWDMDAPGHIKDDVRLANRLRREHAALRTFPGHRFYRADDDHVLYYARMNDDRSSFLLFAVNLDPFHPRGADIEVPLWEFGLGDDATIEATDLVTGDDFHWQGKNQHVYLTPDNRPYAVWQLHAPGSERRRKREADIAKLGRAVEAQERAAERGRA